MNPMSTSAEQQRWYLCVKLKSFCASVECVDRGLDPLTDNLVVADWDCSDATICLAVSPSLQAKGLGDGCRVLDIPEDTPCSVAKPQMERYMEVATLIYRAYLRYVSPCDIHVYSIDECFIDATPHLASHRTDACGFARMLVEAVRDETGICATVGVGTNLFLAKVALDVLAKHEGSGVAVLDERAFRREVWFHRPITDIWGIGPNIARRLKRYGVADLAGVASLRERTLYREFGAAAEYLIDHAWGQEPCTVQQIQRYRPVSRSAADAAFRKHGLQVGTNRR